MIFLFYVLMKVRHLWKFASLHLRVTFLFAISINISWRIISEQFLVMKVIQAPKVLESWWNWICPALQTVYIQIRWLHDLHCLPFSLWLWQQNLQIVIWLVNSHWWVCQSDLFKIKSLLWLVKHLPEFIHQKDQAWLVLANEILRRN